MLICVIVSRLEKSAGDKRTNGDENLVSLFWMQNESHILIISIQSQRFHWRMVEIDDSINKVEQKICTGNNNQFQHLHKHEEIIRLVINDRSSFSRHRVAFSPSLFFFYNSLSITVAPGCGPSEEKLCSCFHNCVQDERVGNY